MNKNHKRIIRLLSFILVVVIILLLLTRCSLNKKTVSISMQTIPGSIENIEEKENDDESNVVNSNIVENKIEHDIPTVYENKTSSNEKTETKLVLSNNAYCSSTPFELSNMYPGDVLEKNYELKVYHNEAVLLDFEIIPQNDSILFGGLNIKVVANNELIYDGLIKEMPNRSKVFVEEDVDEVLYKIGISLPTSAGNEYQNKTCILDLKWEIEKEYEKYMAPVTGVSGIVETIKNNVNISRIMFIILGLVVILLFALREKKDEDRE